MKTKAFLLIGLFVVLGLMVAGWTGPMAAPGAAPLAADQVSLKVLNPQGAVEAVGELAPRLSTLDGKTVALWLSATPDEVYAGMGGPFYDQLAELLKKQFPKINLIPYAKLPMKYSPADEVIAAIKATKPDGVVIALGG